MAAHCHVALGRTLTNNDDRRSATLNPRLGGLKCMRANRHHYAPKSLDSCRAKPERETQPEGAPDNPPSARRCRPNRSESADHAASARPREYGGFKLFLGNTTGNLPCPNDGAVFEGLEILARLGLRCSVHAENSPILFWRQKRLQGAGRNDPLAHLAARTDIVAIEALTRIATLADWTGARIHIVHESCAGSLPFIRFFKDRGTDITVETLPQYLTLAAEEMTSSKGALMRMNPPIRQRAHQAPLLAGLIDGTIDMLATDHAPHAPEEKVAASIWDVACGFCGVQTSLPLMLTTVAEGRISPATLVRAMCGAPARAFGLWGRKGVLRVGAEADVVLVDPAARRVLRAADLASRGNVTPYEGTKVTGWPLRTLVRGRTVALDGKVVAPAGSGQMVRVEMSPPAARNTATTLAAQVRPCARPW